MSKPFNKYYARGATNDQLKTSLVYKPFLKTDDEIEGFRSNEIFSPVIINVIESRGSDELHIPCIIESKTERDEHQLQH